jgi:hypothetical protein
MNSNCFSQDSQKDIKNLNIKIGYANFNFSDPSIVGDNSFFNTGTTNNGSYDGFRGLNGISIKLSYYLNNNLGLLTDVTLTNKNVEHYVDPAVYKTNADMNIIRLGLTGRIIGKDYPVRLNLGTGLGLSIFSFYSSVTNGASGTYLSGEDNYPGVFFNAELVIPIYKSIHFFSQFEYIYVPISNLTLEHDGGNEYYLSYYDANVGGTIIKLGLGIDLF